MEFAGMLFSGISGFWLQSCFAAVFVKWNHVPMSCTLVACFLRAASGYIALSVPGMKLLRIFLRPSIS